VLYNCYETASIVLIPHSRYVYRRGYGF